MSQTSENSLDAWPPAGTNTLLHTAQPTSSLGLPGSRIIFYLLHAVKVIKFFFNF